MREMIAMFYRQLCADETEVAYLYAVIAQQERRPERRVLLQQLSARASDAAGKYAQRGGAQTVLPSFVTRFWLRCVIVFGYSAAFHWIEHIEQRERMLKTTLLRILSQAGTEERGSKGDARLRPTATKS